MLHSCTLTTVWTRSKYIRDWSSDWSVSWTRATDSYSQFYSNLKHINGFMFYTKGNSENKRRSQHTSVTCSVSSKCVTPNCCGVLCFQEASRGKSVTANFLFLMWRQHDDTADMKKLYFLLSILLTKHTEPTSSLGVSLQQQIESWQRNTRGGQFDLTLISLYFSGFGWSMFSLCTL